VSIAVHCVTLYYYAASQYSIDAAYCYRRNTMVCLSVGLFVTILSPAKTAEPIDMLFVMYTRVCPWKYVQY